MEVNCHILGCNIDRCNMCLASNEIGYKSIYLWFQGVKGQRGLRGKKVIRA